jgi:phage antirepressor YoqD-like protein
MEQNTTINPIKVTCVEGEFSGGYDVINNHDKLNQYISWLKLNNWEDLVNLAKNEERIDNYQFSFIYSPPEPEIIEEDIKIEKDNNDQSNKKYIIKDNNKSLQCINFYGDEIITIKDEKKNIIYIPLRQMCTNLGLDTNTQLAKVKADPQKWDQGVIPLTIHGIDYNVICIPIEKLEFWLLSINANRVKPELKEKIILYQNECIEVLHEYWNGSGVVVNKRKTTIPNEKTDIRKLEPIDPKNMKSVQTYVNTLTSHVTELTSHITYLSEQFNYAVETILDQEKMINYLAPKAEYYDTFMDKGNNLTIHEFSKSIPLVVTYSSGRVDSDIGKIKMFELLRQMGFLMNLPGGSMHNLPYARYMNLKIFITRVITTKRGSFTQTLITPKGVTYLVRKFRERGWLPKTYFYNHQQITYNN